ncbi:MAG: leucine-rich repeat domain-containing protein [Candidatus Saelkia tenebricola]|nr:leucine-rich repeat domain-containing protein [Candidatus Saelkia tenebricola]
MKIFIVNLTFAIILIISNAYGFGSPTDFGEAEAPVGTTSSGPIAIANLNSNYNSSTYIPDQRLQDSIRAKLGKEKGEFITYSDMQQLTELDLSSCGIHDITGLEYATNLRNLDLTNNQITDITPLGNLINLNEVNISYNQIRDIRVIANLPNLTILRASYNLIKDITALADSNLSNLTELYLNGNMITDITPLGVVTESSKPIFNNLIELDISDNKFPRLPKIPSDHRNYCGVEEDAEKIKSLHPLQNLSNLTYLKASSNQISDILPLANLTNLVELNLSDNLISNIKPLEKLFNLVDLNLCHNKIRDITPIENLADLTDLNLNVNLINNITPLKNLTNLVWLHLKYNFITDIQPLVDNPGLYTEFPDSETRNDMVDIRWNNLDLKVGSNNMLDIMKLINRCVDIYYEPQECTETDCQKHP